MISTCVARSSHFWPAAGDASSRPATRTELPVVACSTCSEPGTSWSTITCRLRRQEPSLTSRNEKALASRRDRSQPAISMFAWALAERACLMNVIIKLRWCYRGSFGVKSFRNSVSRIPPATTHRHCFAQYEPTSLPTYLSLLFVVIPVPFVLNFRRFWWRVFYVELTLGFSAHAMTHARRSGVIDSGFIGSGTKRIANEINSPIPNQSGNLG